MPEGEERAALEFAHFPTRWQAFIWRNWGLLSAERLARVLATTADVVTQAAADMGLREPDARDEQLWLRRGYVTLIRRNWHLLPYSQILELLDWQPEKLAHVLKEEDFLWTKLGGLKPQCSPLKWQPLSMAGQAETAQLRDQVISHDSGDGRAEEQPFTFNGSYPHFPAGQVGSVGNRFELRLGYAFATLYGDPLLSPGDGFFPDEELAAMRSWGVNAVWFQAILYQLYPWQAAPGLSEGWEVRLQTLRDLVERAAKYDIKVFLYLNEPRCLPTRIFNDLPQLEPLRGVDYSRNDTTSLCTSKPEVLDFVRSGCRHVFTEVPQLGGVFTISLSENPTHCHSKNRGGECKDCSQRPVPEVVAEVNRTIAEGIHSVSPEARVIVWDWAWGCQPNGDVDPAIVMETVDLLPPDVELMVTSGFLMPVTFEGVQALVSDYSISQPGPGPHIEAVMRRAAARGLKVHAKIQANNSWECSIVPYIPVVDLVEQHLRQLKATGAGGVMYSWTLGGYLGGNLGLLQCTPDELATVYGGTTHAPLLREAWRRWSQAFAEFPYNGGLVYNGPCNAGPSNLLYLTPTGYRPTMVGFPYDAVEKWDGIYPTHVLEHQFDKASRMWGEALEWMTDACAKVDPEPPAAVADQIRVAEAVYCNLRSSALQIRFLRMRNESIEKHTPAMQSILDEEISLAQRQLKLLRRDSRIGYEPTNHYLFTANDLLEKIINCLELKARLSPPARA